MPHATLPCLDTFCRPGRLGLPVTGQQVNPTTPRSTTYPRHRHRRVEATGGALEPLEVGVDILATSPNHRVRDQMEIITMDCLAGYKTVTIEELPDAVTVMALFHEGGPAGLEDVRSLGQTMSGTVQTSSRSSTTSKPTTTYPNTSKTQPEESATSPTTSPDPYLTQATSNPSTTHFCEEPLFHGPSDH